MIKKFPKFTLFFLIALTFFVRLYRIDYPIADWHSWRQVDTASVTREYVKHGVDILRPKYHDLGNVQSGLDNLEGWRMVEMPFINALIATLIRAIPSLNLEITSRFVSVLFSIGTVTSLYYLVKKISGQKTAFYSGLVFALLPFSVYYGRVVLPEPAMLFFSTSSLLFFSHYLDSKNKFNQISSFIFSAFFLALALLLKPFVAFLGPIYLTFSILKYKWKVIKHWELVIFVVIAFTPFFMWREWIKQFPSGIPASDWLFNGNGIRLRPAWFRWLFYERLTKIILGWWGWIFILSNFIGCKLTLLNPSRLKKIFSNKKITNEIFIYGSWIFGVLLYLIVIATGNVQHDYYQVFTLPIVSIMVGRGINQLEMFLQAKFDKRNKLVPIFIVSLIFGAMINTAWQKDKGNFNINHWEYIEAGKMIDEITPSDAKVIAPAFSDTLFLYQTNRTGWPIGFDIEDKISKGADYYVSTSYDDETRMVEETYTPVFKNDNFIIVHLVKPEKNLDQ